MAMFNMLEIEFYCPKCLKISKVDAEFRFGYPRLDRYKIGDKLIWGDDKLKKNRPENRRPADGNYIGEGYTECPNCKQDHWLKITVEEDVIKKADVNFDKKGYMQE